MPRARERPISPTFSHGEKVDRDRRTLQPSRAGRGVTALHSITTCLQLKTAGWLIRLLRIPNAMILEHADEFVRVVVQAMRVSAEKARK